jgi:hypothetical protein
MLSMNVHRLAAHLTGGLAAVLLGVLPAVAQNNNTVGQNARPERGPASQTSTQQGNAPPATTKQTTGSPSPNATVAKQNQEAKSKIEKEGK